MNSLFELVRIIRINYTTADAKQVPLAIFL